MSELRELLDRERVTERVVELFVAVDERDWAKAAACFADPVELDGAETTPAAIVEGWKAGLAPIRAIHHQAGNFRVTVDGDAAACACYGVAYHQRPVASGRNTRVFVGSYDLRLARALGAWRITHFRYDLKFIDGNPALDREEPA